MVHTIKIVIDKRESKVIPFFEPYKKSITVVCETIKTGDYCIIYDNVIIAIIERKRWEDLAASIQDGRKHNVQKLLELQKETNCNVFYLIEGKQFPSLNKKFNNLPVKNLMAHLDHLMFRDKIHILYAQDEKHTAERIVSLASNYWSLENSKPLQIQFDQLEETQSQGKLCPPEIAKMLDAFDFSDDETEQKSAIKGGKVPPLNAKVPPLNTEVPLNDSTDGPKEEVKQTNTDSDAMEKLKKNREIISMTAHEQILRAIPKIGSVKSSLLYENKVTLGKIVNDQISSEQLANMTYPNGVIVGLATAKQIIKSCKTVCCSDVTCHKSRIRLLSEIPLVSKKTAEIILSKFKLIDIITRKATKDQLADINKTEKIKLGKKAAENIISYLCD